MLRVSVLLLCLFGECVDGDRDLLSVSGERLKLLLARTGSGVGTAMFVSAGDVGDSVTSSLAGCIHLASNSHLVDYAVEQERKGGQRQ